MKENNDCFFFFVLFFKFWALVMLMYFVWLDPCRGLNYSFHHGIWISTRGTHSRRRRMLKQWRVWLSASSEVILYKSLSHPHAWNYNRRKSCRSLHTTVVKPHYLNYRHKKMTSPRKNDKTKAQEGNARFVIDLNMYRNFQLKLFRLDKPHTNKRGEGFGCTRFCTIFFLTCIKITVFRCTFHK